VEHEANYLHKNLDQFFQYITDRINGSRISEPLKDYLNSHLKCVRYYDKTVFVFEVLGQEQPSLYDQRYFVRRGTQVMEVAPEDYPALFARFR